MRSASAGSVKLRGLTIPTLPASRPTCLSAKQLVAPVFLGLIPAGLRLWQLVAGRCRCSSLGSGNCGRHAVPLPRRFQGVWCRFRTVKVAAINKCCARTLKNNEQEQRQPFHTAEANRIATSCQCLVFFFCKTWLRDVDLAGKFTFRQC